MALRPFGLVCDPELKRGIVSGRVAGCVTQLHFRWSAGMSVRGGPFVLQNGLLRAGKLKSQKEFPLSCPPRRNERKRANLAP